MKYNKDDEGPPFVCHTCIGDKVLSTEIKKKGDKLKCNYCGADSRPSVSISWLGKRIDPVYRALVGEADAVPVITANDNVHWIADGESPGAILAEMIEAADTQIADDIIEELGSTHSWTYTMVTTTTMTLPKKSTRYTGLTIRVTWTYGLLSVSL